MESADAAVPRPRGASARTGAVPIRGRTTGRSASSTALIDGLAPPWQRMPGTTVDRPAVRLARAADGPVADRPEGTGSPVHHPAGDGANPAGPDNGGTAAGRDDAGRAVRPVTDLAARRPAVATELRTPVRTARPRVVEEPSILGLSRRTRSRVGSRLFTLFFVAVFTLIALQMVLEILYG